MTIKIYALDTWSNDRVQLEVLKTKHRILQDTMIHIYESRYDLLPFPKDMIDSIQLSVYNALRETENIDVQYITSEDNNNE